MYFDTLYSSPDFSIITNALFNGHFDGRDGMTVRVYSVANTAAFEVNA